MPIPSLSDRLEKMGFHLPPNPRANGCYVTWHRDGEVLSTSGQLSREGDTVIRGPIGPGDDLATARRAAEVCFLRALAVAREALGDVDQIRGVVSLRGYVACAADFTEHSAVLDAASNLITALFDHAGRHIRTAVGVSSLPSGGLVEIEVVFKVAPQIDL